MSNSFSMCSWTEVGSEVPRMDSSSSSEMKKKRGKAFRLVSRYSLRLFWHDSSSSASRVSSSRRPWAEQASSTFVFLAVSVMIFAQALSMLSNRLASWGSWCRMSSEPTKMLSRYIHFRCTSIHTSMDSPIRLSFPSQSRTSSMNGLTNLLAIIDCRFRPMSSRSRVISSALRRIHPRSSVPFMYLNSSNFCSFQTSATFWSSDSMVSSLPAAFTMSPMMVE